MDRFLSRCREATANDPKASTYVDILLSSADYETFVRLMKIMRPIAMSRVMSANAEGKASSKAKEGHPSSTKHGSSEATEKLSKTWTEEDDEKETVRGSSSLPNDHPVSDAKESEGMSSPSAKATAK
jgi:hypothetical protein